MLVTKTKIESRCGIVCSECTFHKDSTCEGCLNITKLFWGDQCPVKSCAEEHKHDCCGRCVHFPCDILNAFSYDKEQGDNGLRIENCKQWCQDIKEDL